MSGENEEVGFDADLEAGFAGTHTETPEPVAEDQTTQQQQQEEQPAPTYRQITEDDYTKLMSSAAAVDEIKATFGKQFDTAFGKIGGVERILKQFQDQTASGEQVEITEEDIAEIAEDYPELAASQLKVLQRVAGKMRGTGSVSEDQIRQVMVPSLEQFSGSVLDRAKREIATEHLDATHEGWTEVIGMPDAQGNVPPTEYRKWLSTQSADYQSKMLNTFSPVLIGKSIDLFRESQSKLKSDASRRERMADAVSPRGDGGHQIVTDDEDSGFNEGFKNR